MGNTGVGAISRGGLGGFARNATALAVLQFASYIIPFLLFPFLSRTLGVAHFGVVAFGFALAQLLVVVTDYGFNLSATYKIAACAADKESTNRIVGAVLFNKAALLAGGALVMGLYCVAQTKYAHFQLFLLLMLLSAAGQTFQPTWFFQGIERLVGATILLTAARMLFVILVLLTVRGPEDLNLVGASSAISNVIGAIIGMWLVNRAGYRSTWPGLAQAKSVFRESTQFFWSRAAVMSYTTGGTLLLGFTATPIQVAHYAAAEQIYRGAQAAFSPIPQALYPYMVRSKDFELFFKICKFAVACCCIGLALTPVLAPGVIAAIYGQGFAETVPVTEVLAVAFSVAVPSILLGYPFLGAMGRIDKANRSVLYGAIASSIVLGAVWMSGAGVVMVATSVLAAELTVLMFRVIYAKRHYEGARP